ncbi:hypothetical protein ACFGVS_25085 [Mucilaginibacter sp. AW1-7]|uniref:hypothetical protein n=1 Tax=unclassified Mucilaginibacter TaxID=2617802 RepID=UPI002366D011|nr:hypothetical protein [Mucilaginibacter sp. KACC 22773]WDF76775.1 hypothetical protein PQ469_23105 [Mucilaginibacter sp. KACC 22773]
MSRLSLPGNSHIIFPTNAVMQLLTADATNPMAFGIGVDEPYIQTSGMFYLIGLDWPPMR